MQRQQQAGFQGGGAPLTRFREYKDITVFFATLFALTLMVFMRKRVGFQRLQPGALLGMAFLAYVFNGIGNFHVAIPLAGNIGASTQSNSLKYFGLAFLVLGLWQRRLRWKELLAGVCWHGYSAGISYFEFLPIRRDFVYRIVDPAVALLTGLCLRKLGYSGLGLWVVFAALCLRIVEAYAHEQALQRDLDLLNSLIESEVQGEAVDHFEGQNATNGKGRNLQDTAGIPTGADEGLEEVIARRRKEAAARAEVRS